MDILGESRLENFLFKVKPELIDRAENVKLIKEECPQCEESQFNKGQLFGWEYQIGEEKFKYLADQVCTSCKGQVLSKEITLEMSEKRKQMLIENWWHIPIDDQSGFKNYQSHNQVTNNAKSVAVDYCKAFKDQPEINLLMMGNPGTGKTHIAKAVARTLKHQGFKVGYISAVDLFNKIKATFDNGE
ncbi:ATP-binding protein (plasmid) [Bacillus carboniphilus]|uniref:ATP-binding protein n=1 Tax=Bacillus carboniphilus TaxID=86663 RepID=A0ABY9K105_9BACI|nr:ATP-binding protein [Bacillus carboniphilus]WLR44522.1 ATP-binding protein [Bacillus carboniphilus]